MNDRLPYEPRIAAAVSALMWDATEGRNPHGIVNVLRRMASEAREYAYRHRGGNNEDRDAEAAWRRIAEDIDMAQEYIDAFLAARGDS